MKSDGFAGPQWDLPKYDPDNDPDLPCSDPTGLRKQIDSIFESAALQLVRDFANDSNWSCAQFGRSVGSLRDERWRALRGLDKVEAFLNLGEMP